LKPPRILIAGAGYAGTRLALQLHVHRQAEVFLLRRSPPESVPGITFLQADLTRPETLHVIPPGIDGIAFCAAARRDHPSSYADLFIRGQQHLLDFFQTRGDPVTRYVMMSTTGVYGDTQGEWVDEDTPPVPTHPGPADILRGEQLIQSGPFPGTAVRFSGIYGPGRNRLLRAVRNREAYVLPGDPIFLNQIHVSDVSGVIDHLLFFPDAAPLYLASDTEPATRGEVLTWIADQLNAPPPREDAERAPQPRHGNKRCRNQRLLNSGYEFLYPTFREGYGELLREGRARY
jgi:nucleoside-diphosphate-sugar epimerase